MKISVISSRELDVSSRGRWLELQRSNPGLASPFFCPEFTVAVGDVCCDVRIAVLEEENRIIGFFPFQSRCTIGAPVGRLLSDYHGVVCAPGTRWNWPRLLRAAGLSCFHFYNLCAEQAPPTAVKRLNSLALDLSAGFEAYNASLRSRHPASLNNLMRKKRRFEREAGTLRLLENALDPAVFAALLRLKFDQYRRSGAINVLELGWVRDVLERIRQARFPHFGGRLAALYAGDRLAAAQLGMRSEFAWHGWFAAYDPSLSKFSPGVQLLMLLANNVAGSGYRMLDLGKGDEGYKRIFADRQVPLAEGVFTRSNPVASLTLAAYSVFNTTRQWKHSLWGGRVRALSGRNKPPR